MFSLCVNAQTLYEYKWSREVIKLDSFNTVKIMPIKWRSGSIEINELLLVVKIKPEREQEQVLSIDMYSSIGGYPITFEYNGNTCYLNRRTLTISYENKIIQYRLKQSL